MYEFASLFRLLCSLPDIVLLKVTRPRLPLPRLSPFAAVALCERSLLRERYRFMLRLVWRM